MTVSRSELVDSSLTSFYHCITRCVRRARLCGEGCEHRKEWIENRLRELHDIFAVDVAGYAILDNHMHVVLMLNDDIAAGWSDEETVRRWGKLFPPRGKDRQPVDVSEAWVAEKLKDAKWVTETRKRLNSLSWFMKCLKEPLARMANREDECKGTFFESRFKSIAILDEEALLTTLAYVDLNPLAAGIAKTPEESDFTSVKARVENAREDGTLADIVDQPADRTQHDVAVEDDSFWLVPIEERREQGGTRKGISPHMNLASYLRLLDWSARLVRRGKASLPRDVADILTRLGTSAELWSDRMKKLTSTSRIYGCVFATNRSEIDRVASSRGVRKLSNLNGCRR